MIHNIKLIIVSSYHGVTAKQVLITLYAPIAADVLLIRFCFAATVYQAMSVFGIFSLPLTGVIELSETVQYDSQS